MNQSYQAFLVPLFLLLLLVSLFSCGEMTRQIIGSNSERFSEVDIKIDTATVASEVIQVKGSIYDLTYPDEPLLFASVTVLNNGKSIAGTETNFDGDFEIILSVDSLDSTDFALEMAYLGYQTLRIVNIHASRGDMIQIHVRLSAEYELERFQWNDICVPLIQLDDMTSGQTFTSDQIRRSPTRGR